MRDHKPECVLSDPCSADEPRHGFCGNWDTNWCIHCEQECICERIKRAEDRVLKDTVPGEWHEKRMAWVRKDALGKAMEAVAELEFFRTNPATIIRPWALASIDALRRKP